MMITKLVGALVKGSQSLKIEPGMIATKKARNGGDIFAAHCQCIEYVAVLFDEGVLMSELNDTMQTIRGYNIGLHENLEAIKNFLETDNSADEKLRLNFKTPVSTRLLTSTGLFLLVVVGGGGAVVGQ